MAGGDRSLHAAFSLYSAEEFHSPVHRRKGSSVVAENDTGMKVARNLDLVFKRMGKVFVVFITETLCSAGVVHYCTLKNKVDIVKRKGKREKQEEK